MELDKKCESKNLKVEGFMEKGKQYDLDITLPEDNRDLIYGIIKDCHGDPVEDAAIKLVEVCYEYGEKELKPVSHTFSDKHGEFVFGPLCPDREYSLQIWVDRVKHVKMCIDCQKIGKCLKGEKIDCPPDFPCKDQCDCFPPKK
jgi:hypothetical protein